MKNCSVEKLVSNIDTSSLLRMGEFFVNVPNSGYVTVRWMGEDTSNSHVTIESGTGTVAQAVVDTSMHEHYIRFDATSDSIIRVTNKYNVVTIASSSAKKATLDGEVLNASQYCRSITNAIINGELDYKNSMTIGDCGLAGASGNIAFKSGNPLSRFDFTGGDDITIIYDGSTITGQRDIVNFGNAKSNTAIPLTQMIGAQTTQVGLRKVTFSGSLSDLGYAKALRIFDVLGITGELTTLLEAWADDGKNNSCIFYRFGTGSINGITGRWETAFTSFATNEIKIGVNIGGGEIGVATKSGSTWTWTWNYQ